MIKYLARFESIVDGKVGHFLLEHDTTTKAAKEMCLEFIKYLGQIEDNAQKLEDEKKESTQIEEQIKEGSQDDASLSNA